MRVGHRVASRNGARCCGAKPRLLADEILTPDSSRFWPAATYAPGRNQDSFDKQYIRDWMESINYNKTDPLTIPQDRVMMTVEKYKECFLLITGKPVDLSTVGL